MNDRDPEGRCPYHDDGDEILGCACKLPGWLHVHQASEKGKAVMVSIGDTRTWLPLAFYRALREKISR